MKKTLIGILLGFVSSPLFADITIQTSGSPTYPMGGKFYGYRSSGNGPGDTAFDEAKALAEENHVLLFIVWGKDGCSTCSQYISNLDEQSRAAPKMLSYKNSINAYFRGKADSPAACKACYNFLCKTVGASGSCHIMAAYGVAEDGAVYKKWCSLITDYTTSGKKKVSWCDEFETFKAQHPKPPYVPPAASAAFACGSSSGARMEATMETERIFVPFVRTNCLDKAEHNALRAWFANGQSVDVDLDWAIGQKNAEVDFYMTGRYQAGTKIQLGLVNTNGVEIATNYIYCVDSKANSFSYPRYVGETNGYAFGEWTLDYAMATNAVVAANGCTLRVTGSPVWNAKSIAFKSVFDSAEFKDWCVSKKVATVLVETKERATGASLFSHKIAANKTSGTPFISSKGISMLDDAWNPKGETIPIGGDFTVELFRADGTLAGQLAPQFNADGTCDVEENLTRLDELLKEADDPTETANDSAATPLVFDWPATVSQVETNGQTLAVSDTEDWFRLTGEGWSQGKVVLGIAVNGTSGTTGTDGTANLHFEVVVKGKVVEPDLTPLWVGGGLVVETNYTFSANDIAASNVFVRAIAYEGASTQTAILGETRFGYALTARPIASSAGMVSFVDEEDVVLKDVTNKVYEVNLCRVLGFSGDVRANVYVDLERTDTTNFYFNTRTIPGAGESVTNVTVSWSADDPQDMIKTIPMLLLGDDLADGMKKITLCIEIEKDASAETGMADWYYARFTLSYGVEPGSEGVLYIDGTAPSAKADGRVWVRRGSGGDDDDLSVWVARSDAKGPASVSVNMKSGNKKVADSVLLDWEEYRMTSKEACWMSTRSLVDDPLLPEPNSKLGYLDVVVSLSSTNAVPPIDSERNSVNVRILRGDAPVFASESVTWGDAVQYVAFSNAVDVVYSASGAAGVRALPADWTVQGATKISGAVPTGLKVSADKATGALVVTGTPTAAGETQTSIWWMKFKDGDDNVVMSSPVTLTISVKALAKTDVNPEGLIPGFDSARAWTGLPLVDSQTKRLAGLLDMTVAKNGRTTAKWRKAGGKNVSFSAASLTGCYQNVPISEFETGAYVYVKVAKLQASITNEFVVRFGSDGSIWGSVREGEGNYAPFAVPAAEVWSKTHTAEAWEGDYTLAFPHDNAFEFNDNTLCFGATSLRVKFNSIKTGKATFAGYLPNGRSVSGTAVFVPATNGAEVATLPIFYSTSADTFGAVVDVAAADEGGTRSVASVIEGSETATNFWQHVESGLPEASYENDYAAVGARYEADDWEEAWGETYQTNALSFDLDGNDVGARIAAKGATLKVAEKGELKSLAFALNKTSGMTTGSFRDSADAAATREPFAGGKTATWRGVALPSCKPFFMTGAYWYTKVYEYEDANGNAKTRSVKAGGAVTLKPAQAE